MTQPTVFRCGWFLDRPEGQCPENGVVAQYIVVYPPTLRDEPRPASLLLCEKHWRQICDQKA